MLQPRSCCYLTKPERHSAVFRTLLTLLWQRSLSYRHRSINLQSKSMDWNLYDRDLRPERVKCLCWNFCDLFWWTRLAEVHSEPRQTSKMKIFCEISKRLLAIFAKIVQHRCLIGSIRLCSVPIFKRNILNFAFINGE